MTATESERRGLTPQLNATVLDLNISGYFSTCPLSAQQFETAEIEMLLFMLLWNRFKKGCNKIKKKAKISFCFVFLWSGRVSYSVKKGYFETSYYVVNCLEGFILNLNFYKESSKFYLLYVIDKM